METELKLRILGRVRPRDLEGLDWSPYQLGPRQRHRLRDTVLDTRIERSLARTMVCACGAMVLRCT